MNHHLGFPSSRYSWSACFLLNFISFLCVHAKLQLIISWVMVHHEFQIQMLLLLSINHVPSSQLQLEHCFLGNVRGGSGFVCHAKQVPWHACVSSKRCSVTSWRGSPCRPHQVEQWEFGILKIFSNWSKELYKEYCLECLFSRHFNSLENNYSDE
jgi:hypothetical protein